MKDHKLNSIDIAEKDAPSTSVLDVDEILLEGSWKLNFEGKGSELFRIFMENFFLNLMTLGIHYPWAKAR